MNNKKIAYEYRVSITHNRRKYWWYFVLFDHYADYNKFVERKGTRGLTWVTTKPEQRSSAGYCGTVCFARKFFSQPLLAHEIFHTAMSFWRYVVKGNITHDKEEYLAELIELLTWKINKKFIVGNKCRKKR